MALPTTVLGQFAADINEVFAGTISDVWLVEGEIIIPAVQSFKPSHGISLNSIPAIAKAYSTRLSGGVDGNGVAQVSRLDFSANPADSDTVTIDSVVYTFKTTASLANDVQIGANALATANALVLNVNDDLTVGAQGVVTNTSPTAPQITFTAEVAGTAFTIVESSTALSVTVITANTPDTSGVKAQVTVKFVGTRHKAGTINQLTIPMVVGTITPKTERIRFQFDTPADSSTNADIATGLHDVLIKARDNTPITAGTGKRYFSTNVNNSLEEISTAIQNLFGDATANNITVSTDTITIKAKDKSVNGNFIGIGCEVQNSMPSPVLTCAADGTPQVPGIPIHLGAQDGFVAAVSPTKQVINASNFDLAFGNITTGQTLDISFKLFQDDNLDFQKYGLSKAAVTYDDTNNVLLFAGAPLVGRYGLILTSPSKRVSGDFDMLVFYSVESAALSINRAKNTVNGLDVKFSPNPFNRQGDPVGYLKQPRSL